MNKKGSRRLAKEVAAYQAGVSGQNSMRRYLGAFLISASITLVAVICFKIVFAGVMILLNFIDAAADNIFRSTHKYVINRFDNDLHIEAEIDHKIQISRVFLSPRQQRTCLPRDTVKDFEKVSLLLLTMGVKSRQITTSSSTN